MSTRDHQQGFTLLEVLVALAILAVALITGLKAITQNTNNAFHLKDKTLAEWVAMNQLNEIRLSEQWPSGDLKGTTQMAGKEWQWHVEVTETPEPTIRRLDASVSSTETPDQVIFTAPTMILQPK